MMRNPQYAGECWAVHNIDAAAVLMECADGAYGYRLYPGSPLINIGAPIFTAATTVEAENWRHARIVDRLEAAAMLLGGPGLLGAVRNALRDGATLKKTRAMISDTCAAL